MKIAILGGGHGCHAAAADLSEAGHEVSLWRRDATPERVAGAALRLLASPDALAAQRRAFSELADELGTPGVASRAARLILGVGSAPSEPPSEIAGEARARTADR